MNTVSAMNKTLHLFAPCPLSPVRHWGVATLPYYRHAVNYRWGLAADWLDTVLVFDKPEFTLEAPCSTFRGK